MKSNVELTNYLASKKKVDDVLALERITLDDIACFSKMERDSLAETSTEILNSLKGEEKKIFFSKIEQVVAVNFQNEFWEYNHRLITDAISKLMCTYCAMPSKSAIARETGLSRQTVTKHLKEYKTKSDYIEEMDRFNVMTSKVMASVGKSAMNGDMRASRLYLEMVGAVNKKSPGGMVVNEQNNYIQINNTILSQENLKKLSAEQLNQIELIVTGDAAR